MVFKAYAEKTANQYKHTTNDMDITKRLRRSQLHTCSAFVEPSDVVRIVESKIVASSGEDRLAGPETEDMTNFVASVSLMYGMSPWRRYSLFPGAVLLSGSGGSLADLGGGGGGISPARSLVATSVGLANIGAKTALKKFTGCFPARSIAEAQSVEAESFFAAVTSSVVKIPVIDIVARGGEAVGLSW